MSRLADDPGPILRYTNEHAHAVTESVRALAHDYNEDGYRLLKWAADLRKKLSVAREALEEIEADANDEWARDRAHDALHG